MFMLSLLEFRPSQICGFLVWARLVGMNYFSWPRNALPAHTPHPCCSDAPSFDPKRLSALQCYLLQLLGANYINWVNGIMDDFYFFIVSHC